MKDQIFDDKVSLGRRFKFNIQNNSERSIIIDKIRISTIDTIEYEDYVVSYFAKGYPDYEIKEQYGFVSKNLPLKLESMSYVDIYLSYDFYVGKDASKKIKDEYLEEKDFVSITYEEFENFKNREGFFVYDSIINKPKIKNRFKIEILTSKENIFSESFGFYFDRFKNHF